MNFVTSFRKFSRCSNSSAEADSADGQRGWALISVLWTMAMLGMMAAATQDLTVTSVRTERRALARAHLENDLDESLHDKLSNRELEVLRCIAEGKPLTTIAEELFLSVKTISTYRTRILDKLHMRSNADIIRYAIRADLVQA